MCKYEIDHGYKIGFKQGNIHCCKHVCAHGYKMVVQLGIHRKYGSKQQMWMYEWV